MLVIFRDPELQREGEVQGRCIDEKKLTGLKKRQCLRGASHKSQKIDQEALTLIYVFGRKYV